MPAIVYGQAGGLTEAFLVQPGRRYGLVAHPGDGASHWALVHVADIADLYGRALELPAGSAYLGVTENQQVRDIAQASSIAAGCPGRAEPLSADEAGRRFGPPAEAFLLDQRLTSERANAQLGRTPHRRDALTGIAAG